MEPSHNNIENYKLYIFTFIGLSILTLLAVFLTTIKIAPVFAVCLIMGIAIIQAYIVLFYNMHLKFHDKILTVFVGAVFTLLLLIILITALDFVDR